MVFETLAKGIVKFIDYGLAVLVIMLIWEGFKLIGKITGKASGKISAKKAEKLGKGLTEWKKSPVARFVKGIAKNKKVGLRGYINLEKLKKEVEKAKNDADLNKLKKKKRKAERNERRGHARLARLEVDLGKKVKKDSTVKKRFGEIEAANQIIIDELKKFDVELASTNAFATKQANLISIVNATLTADAIIIKAYSKLDKYLNK